MRIIWLASIGADGEVEEKIVFETCDIVGEGILCVSIIPLILSL